MEVIRRNAKLVSVLLAILMFSTIIPYQSALAAMIETETMLDATRAQQARDGINSLLLREDVQNALMAQGINPIEAKARIDSLSDAEVIRIANEIDKLSERAGGYSFSTFIPAWVVVAAVAVVVLIIVGIVYLATRD
jgi:hypothetical protein